MDGGAIRQLPRRRIAGGPHYWTAAPGGPAFYADSTNYLIDLDAGIIVDVEATPAHRTEEVESTRTMIERVEQKFDLLPKRLVADTAYGAAPMLNCIVKKKRIEPHVPVWEKSIRDDGTFSRPDFRVDRSATHTSVRTARSSRALAAQPTLTPFSSELANTTAAAAP
jgi:hypothetical protein